MKRDDERTEVQDQAGDTSRRNKGGRPKRDSIQLTREARDRLDRLAAENAEKIFAALLEAALDGDMTACRILADRVWPSRRGASVNFTPPVLRAPSDVPVAYQWLLGEVAAGRLTTEEGQAIDGMIERRAKAFELITLAEEVERLKVQLDAVLGPRQAA
jgi:hypothetical protein